MAWLPGVRAFLRTRPSLSGPRALGSVRVLLTATGPPRGFCSHASKLPVNPENQSLLQNLSRMGVDVNMARRRQPGVLRRECTNEKGLSRFLQGKGASLRVIAGIVSRYPRAITRSVEHLEQRWKLWRNVFQTDAQIVSILDRSPESFFRSSDNGNLEKNIAFLTSLGLNGKDLHRMLSTAPRTFSNSVELNKQMVEFLEDVCAELGGSNPEQFAKTVISRNLYILIRSTRRVRANIDNLRASLHLSDSELLALLQGHGADILDLSSEYLKKNFRSLEQKMTSLGCQEEDLKRLIISYPMVLYIGPETLNTKLDCLLKGGITVSQILKKPKVLDYSTQNIMERLQELQRVGYDFHKNGINILDTSRKRFVAKMEKLASEEGTQQL
uniref:Mitochondrial transcription termination factor 1 n=1 Tax=Oryzias sinensis TaxID=183150 RepID=A0A8C7WSJ0_9TELE